MPYYETPILPVNDVIVCREFALRPGLWRVVFDHLSKLTRDWQWSESDGGMTVEQATGEIRLTIDAAVFRGCTMLGQILWIAVDVPAWAILCDGTQYSRVDYPDLYAALQSGYVVDADNFVVPDLIDRFALGSALAGAEGGEGTHVLTEAEMPAHSHVEQDPGIVQVQPGTGAFPLSDPGLPGETGDTGGGQAHNNMPPWHSLTPVIVARWPDA